MKILGMSPWYILIALIVGLVLAFGAGFLMVPKPVDVHKVVITPVPTPAPVYVEEPVEHPAPAASDGSGESVSLVEEMNMAGTVFSFMTLGMFVIVATLILAMVSTLLMGR